MDDRGTDKVMFGGLLLMGLVALLVLVALALLVVGGAQIGLRQVVSLTRVFG